ncbi:MULTISPECIES: molybdopterin-dependent oxidoreductase [Sulfurimonas]|uniref:molybdopterin-dependent oxidoreductase n=1 Tax=Sulfurimonas TaxID=202746 RepID=UPI0012641136|nr:molybdopterin-dependent oxidoreductase [Sulfurimonas indica]
MHRREFFKISFAAATAIVANLEASNTIRPRDNQKVLPIKFPQKRELILHSDRPPLLETPRDFFTTAITPNDAFFVRWHMPIIPTATNLDTYYVHIHGEVEKRLYLTVDMLKNDFEAVEVTAVMQCGGNSRSAFRPTTSGIQWGSGAMGCATFKGVRLKDILKKAGLKEDARWISLNGNDKAVMTKIENFKRELKIDEISDDTIVAYEMNGEEIPFLNGYPLRLIIPGFYADSWVKQLSDIYVTKEYQKYFFMDVAYRIPDNECECEEPDNLAKKTKPLEYMNVKSYIGYPKNNQKVKRATNLRIKGVAFDAGEGIKAVQISLDGGKTWQSATLADELSRYAFRVFTYNLKPMKKGKLQIMAKAINNKGEEQPFAHEIKWNHGGYKYNGIDSVTVTVV